MDKPHFGYDYWINRLIQAGQAIEPEKYTPEHIEAVKRAWRTQPMTRLVQKAEERVKQKPIICNTQ